MPKTGLIFEHMKRIKNIKGLSETKIGDVIKYNNRELIVTEVFPILNCGICSVCFFKNLNLPNCAPCNPYERRDGKNVVYLEFRK